MDDQRRHWDATGQRIERVEWLRFRIDPPGDDLMGVLRLTTDQGAVGFSLFDKQWAASPGGHDRLAAALIGVDAGDPEAAIGHLERAGIPDKEFIPADLALWDLMGKIHGRPVHGLLGARQARITAKFAIDAGPGPCAGASLAKAADSIRWARSNGISSCHIHRHLDKFHRMEPGLDRVVVDDDIAAFIKLREVAGVDVELIADCHHGYTLDEASRVGEALAELAYRQLESPMPENNTWMPSYVELTRRVRTPICAPEIVVDHTRWGGALASTLPWMDSGAMDVARSGNKDWGFTKSLWIARAAARRGLRFDIHNEGDFTFFYTLQITAAFAAEQTGQYAFYGMPSREPVIQPWLRAPTAYLVDGFVPVPASAGMGVEVDWDHLAKHTVPWS